MVQKCRSWPNYSTSTWLSSARGSVPHSHMGAVVAHVYVPSHFVATLTPSPFLTSSQLTEAPGLGALVLLIASRLWRRLSAPRYPCAFAIDANAAHAATQRLKQIARFVIRNLLATLRPCLTLQLQFPTFSSTHGADDEFFPNFTSPTHIFSILHQWPCRS